MRALVVEDETRLAENLARILKTGAGYAVDLAHDGGDGLSMAASDEYDLIILDLMLPGIDGAQVLSRLRKAGIQTPVLVLTARDDKESIVRLLNDGADDYLAKPFDLGELLARAKALVRRGKNQASPILAVGDLRVDSIRRTVHRGEREIKLTPMEYRVLEYLAHQPERVISKAELLEHLYDYNCDQYANVIEVYIWGLRKKIDEGADVKLIHTFRGQGYSIRFKPEGA